MGQHTAAITGRSLLDLRPEPVRAGDPGNDTGSNGPAAVFVVDIDQFKQVNDRYGRIAGDAVISEIARVIKQEVGKTDFLGRLGGDEFVVLMKRHDDLRAQAFRITERIRRGVGELHVSVTAEWGEVSVSDLSVSIGASVSTTEMSNTTGIAKLLWTADCALYSAKRAGCNRVCIEEISD